MKKCIELNKHDLKVTLGHLGTIDWYNNQEATIELKLNPNKTYDLNTKKYLWEGAIISNKNVFPEEELTLVKSNLEI